MDVEQAEAGYFRSSGWGPRPRSPRPPHAAPATAGAPPALRVADLGKGFRSGLLRRRLRGIEGVSFTVNPGEIFALLGHNGAGKTTTINCILDLCHAETGAVEIFGAGPPPGPLPHRAWATCPSAPTSSTT